MLSGGNVAVLAAGVGTPAAGSASGGIVVLEDVGERPYRLDRALTQLLRSGWFEGVRGAVCGEFVDCGPPAEVRAVLADRLEPLRVPLVYDAPVGHGLTNRALPFGVRARLDATGPTATLTVDEPLRSGR